MPQSRSYWFVGASFLTEDGDQTDRFLSDGIWQNGYQNKYTDLVRSIQVGDKIAIKSAYVRKHNLPFNNRDQSVSVMGIKATGVVTKNHGDGRYLDVDWEPRIEPPKEWYFYTNRSTIWRITPNDWMTEGLVNFAFNSESQEIDRFRNDSYWKERFGDVQVEKQRFKWTQFYEEFAEKLLKYKGNRTPLINTLHELSTTLDALTVLQDQPEAGIKEPLEDICPFTVFAIFNRGITDSNRKSIAQALANFLGVKTPVPDTFEGIPVVNNQRTWFFAYKYRRQETDIDVLWELFALAIHYSDEEETVTLEQLSRAYNNATKCWGVGWNVTMGLYWIRPWKFLTLDGQSQTYITKKLALVVEKNGEKNRSSAKDYFKLITELETRFKEDAYPVHSFPELSLASWLYQDGESSAHPYATDLDEIDSEKAGFIEFPVRAHMQITDKGEQVLNQPEEVLDSYKTLTDLIEAELIPIQEERPIIPYGLEEIISDGSFVEPELLEGMLDRLRSKKNIIIQGPPGTGKTWLGKRLAFALMGQKNDKRLRAVQFHPNLSYEDFVRGWRPAGDGKLALVDGPFLEMIEQAKEDANNKYVIVIEEINRGNPAQILGEMLTLLEADKRTPNEALELSYRRHEGEKAFIPDNLYVIGTMNIADRSLALVDFALRRRFAFIDLKPAFGEPWRNWVHEKSGIEADLLLQIEERLLTLNQEITDDTTLGAQFVVGHSYVTPAFNNKIEDATKWFKSVVRTEIGPLLDEYWFDDLERSEKAQEALTAGM